MRKQWIYVVQLLSLATIIMLAVGCEDSPSTETQDFLPAPLTKPTAIPSASPYPADISGRVTIAEKVKCLTAIAVPPNRDTDVFWVVDISVKNNTYSDSVKADFQMSYKGWVITVNNKEYIPVSCGSKGENPPIDLTSGQMGKFMLHFSVPKTLQIDDAQICYKGQEPYSYGVLTFDNKVTAYDWGSKKEIKEVDDLGEIYVVPDEHFNTRNMRLRTVEQWTGSEARVIEFDIDKSPWVINGSYDIASSLGHKFEYLIFTEDEYSVPEEAFQRLMSNQLLMPIRFPAGDNYLVKQSGKFYICVYASGVNWQLKVGVE